MGIFRKIGMAAAVSMLFVACGDDNSTKANDNEPTGPVSNADYEADDFEDLPHCTSKKEGATGFVVKSGEGYVCKGGDWVRDDEAVDIVKSSSSQKTGSSSSGEKEGESSSSSTKSPDGDGSSSSGGGSVTLRKCAADFDGKYMGYEGSTYKCYEGFWNPVENPPENTETQVICLKTEDPNAPLYCYLDTAIWSSSSYEADAEDFTNRDPVKITGGSIEGVAQKGPYLQGSTYRIIPLDGKTLLPVGDTLNESFNNSIGTYTFCDLEMPSQFAMIEASGYYRSELTGNKSNLQMTIGAIVDVQKGANINILTNLEYERVKYLVQNEGYNIAGAKKRALTEVLAAFHVDADVAVDASGNKLSAEQLDITKDGTANGALLAVSIMIQGAASSSEFDVKAMMKDFRDDIKEDGTWSGKSTRTVIADFAFVADSARKFADYRKNVEGWKLSRVVPMFEQYINDFWASEYGIGKCTEDRFGTIKKNQNVASVYKDKYFICDSLKYSVQYEKSGFETFDVLGNCVNCVSKFVSKFYQWHRISDLEYNTRNQVCNVKGLIIPGNIDKDKYYICDNGWREATGVEVDKYYTECTTDGKLNKFSDEKYYVCDADTFRVAVGNDTLFDFACTSYGEGTKKEKKEIEKNGCASRIIFAAGICQNSSWITTVDTTLWDNSGCNIGYGKLEDSRDGQIYKTVKIGNQTWMAENLNYETAGSYCYGNSADSCAKYGRLYTWSETKNVCPSGWFLPSKADFETLMDAVGARTAGKVLKSTIGWYYGNGTDAYGFSALPAGYYSSYYEEFVNLGVYAHFWSSTEYGSRYAYYLRIYDDYASVSDYNKTDGNSVRCLQD